MDRTLIIRADATPDIGTGHLMRNLALAREWKARGGNVVFASVCTSPELADRITRAGMTLTAYPAVPDTAEDLDTTQALIRRHRAAWTILDGYHFPPDLPEGIRETGCALLMLDDYNHRPFYGPDILVNHNPCAPDLGYCCAERTVTLFGPAYAFIREEFLNETPKTDHPGRARRILVTMGGADTENITGQILKALEHLSGSPLEIRVIIGPGFPAPETIEPLAPASGPPVEFIRNPADMAGQMAWADIGISAAGSTCWELAYMGLPSLLVTAAENQALNAAAFDKMGIFISLGHYRELTPENITGALRNLAEDKALREKMSARQQTLMDGRGAARIIDRMTAMKGRSI
ncbi:MAG: UDP-2,4-diacetamido-2,4,6-trideoxy-beta-L-altropyranose hydrolase [Desulfobacter sp.]